MGENKGVGNDVEGRSPHIDADEVGSDMTTPKSKRTTSPAFQFYPESWFASSKVKRMSHTEKGIYIDLLAQCWLDNGLPTDLKQIAALVGMPVARFQKVWIGGALSECFVERGGRLVNNRQEKERKKQQEFKRRQSDNAAHGWQRRRNAVALPDERHSGITRALEREIETGSETPDQKKRDAPLDVAFAKFRDAYPKERRKGGYLVQQQFMSEVEKAGGSARLMNALENHVASEQWSNPQHIPGMDVWLREERWRQVLASKNAGVAVAKTPWEPLSVTLARTAAKS